MKKILPLLFLIFLLIPAHSFAAEVFFGAQAKEVGVGNKIEIGVFMDTKGEDINAVEGRIHFPADGFDLSGFYSGSSILTFWVEQPKSGSRGTISFSGIVPGGFSGARGYLFSVILTAKEKGKFQISSSDETILLNDGQGSETSVTRAPLELNVVEKSSTTFNPLYDNVPPEAFVVQVGRDSNVFDNQYFAVFASQDKISGIDHYEIAETAPIGSFRNFFEKKNWVAADSPYRLKDQSLRSVISVKAVDKAGNETVAKASPRRFIPWYESYFFWCTIVIIIIFSKYRLWKKPS